jgi:hypothetical protein
MFRTLRKAKNYKVNDRTFLVEPLHIHDWFAPHPQEIEHLVKNEKKGSDEVTHFPSNILCPQPKPLSIMRASTAP